MIVTTKGKNALKMMIDLALYQKEKYIRLQDIAEREGISEKYLEQIVPYLQNSGKLDSCRGKNGGYKLVKDPAEYTVGEIIRSVEGNLTTSECVRPESLCSKKAECLCYPLWMELDKAINGVLDEISLKDLADGKDLNIR